MKKLISVIFFAVLIFPSSVFAQEITIPLPTINISPSIAPTPVQYELPYPGILPGAPLYAVKLMRDKVTDLLTSSALKKSDFYLHQADKRLAAGLILFEKGDRDLAEETIADGLHYLDKSYSKMLEAKKTNEDVLDIHLKLKTSTAKQLEEIERIESFAEGEEVGKLKIDYQKALEIQNKVNLFNS